MNKPQTNNPRARLQQLQAIPDRQRTDEEWDELNELEIMLAMGSNRDLNAGHGVRREGGQPGQGKQQNRPQHGQPQQPGQQKKQHNRPPKKRR
jgi:hypothetical protein